jgi:hypothetical protein
MSRRRPTKLVVSAGTLPTRRLGLAITTDGSTARLSRHYASDTQCGRFGRGALGITLLAMFDNQAAWRVEVSFIGTPPTHHIRRASGVSEVEVVGHAVRCVVSGSFQPFLEALRGHEVIRLTSTPAFSDQRQEPQGGDD